MDLTTVARCRAAFYRLVGSLPEDEGLTELGETENEVAHTFLTRGSRSAQRWMLKCGYHGWLRRAPIEWEGSESEGGLYASLPSDLLRVAGDERRSGLLRDNGERWGHQRHPDE